MIKNYHSRQLVFKYSLLKTYSSYVKIIKLRFIINSFVSKSPQSYRAIQLVHQFLQLAPEIASDADEVQFTSFSARVSLEDLLDQGVLTLHRHHRQRPVQGIVVLLNEFGLVEVVAVKL